MTNRNRQQASLALHFVLSHLTTAARHLQDTEHAAAIARLLREVNEVKDRLGSTRESPP